jgi:hypothetical protein
MQTPTGYRYVYHGFHMFAAQCPAFTRCQCRCHFPMRMPTQMQNHYYEKIPQYPPLPFLTTVFHLSQLILHPKSSHPSKRRTLRPINSQRVIVIRQRVHLIAKTGLRIIESSNCHVPSKASQRRDIQLQDLRGRLLNALVAQSADFPCARAAIAYECRRSRSDRIDSATAEAGEGAALTEHGCVWIIGACWSSWPAAVRAF